MRLNRILIACMTVVALTSYVIADNGLFVGDRGVRVSMTTRDDGTSQTNSAISDWAIKSNVNQVVLHWKTTPFVYVDHDEYKSDAFIAAVVTDRFGPIQVSPQASQDQTRLADGDEEASVAMGLRGNGKVNIQLQVGIDGQDAVAGRHCANVTLTLTSH